MPLGQLFGQGLARWVLAVVAMAAIAAGPFLVLGTDDVESGADGSEVGPQVILAAGDIAECEAEADEATARLLDANPGTVATLGDNAYPDGSLEDYQRCYEPSWGRHKVRTRPSPGNHEYDTPGAAGYFSYFGEVAGDPDEGYYSYELGTHWHVLVLNSECDDAGGCFAGSPQERWLRSELAAHADKNILAYWHIPRFSSGEHGGNVSYAPFWHALYDARADIVLNGHGHNYERFAPQDPDGRPDPDRGIRQFVVGTGGTYLRPFPGPPLPTTEVRDDDTHGVLKLTLYQDRYRWVFLPAASDDVDSGMASFSDAGTASTIE